METYSVLYCLQCAKDYNFILMKISHRIKITKVQNRNYKT